MRGTTKAAAMFGIVNTKLACYVSVQNWSGATIAGSRAMEKLAEQMLIMQNLPLPTKEYEESEDQIVPDSDNQGAIMTT